MHYSFTLYYTCVTVLALFNRNDIRLKNEIKQINLMKMLTEYEKCEDLLHYPAWLITAPQIF